MDKLYVYGDSISMQYGFPLKEILESKGITYDRLGGGNSTDPANPAWNGETSRKMLAWISNVDVKQADTILLFNCGLHDIAQDGGAHVCQVSRAEYRRNLQEIIKTAKEIYGGIVFVNSIPVDEARHNRLLEHRKRYSKDLCDYNRTAAEVCREEDIKVVDLYGLTYKQIQAEGGDNVYRDHIHVRKKMCQRYAEEIVLKLTEWGYMSN